MRTTTTYRSSLHLALELIVTPLREHLPTRNTQLGEGLNIRRALPHRHRRLIGAWCFLDHAGPMLMHSHREFRVGPHPHTGLQTFSWMIAGEILHRDSLGYEQVLRPGQVNLMTAGRGISHSEEGVPFNEPTSLHLAQLWIALPDSHRNMAPAFQHYPQLPGIERDGLIITLLAGNWLEATSPVQVYSPLLGADLRCMQGVQSTLPLNPEFEHGVLVLEGSAAINGESLNTSELLYLGVGTDHLEINAQSPTHLLLLGGQPMNENVLLWWNFVARTEAEIIEATEQWNAGSARFGEVKGYDGARLIAPSVVGLHLRT